MRFSDILAAVLGWFACVAVAGAEGCSAPIQPAELISLVASRNATLSEYSVTWRLMDLAGNTALPDTAIGRLAVRGGSFRWDIDFDLGPDDHGFDLHATSASDGARVLHWRRTKGNADIWAAPAVDEMQHMLPKQNSWPMLYLWPPVPGVPAIFDPLAVLSDPTSVVTPIDGGSAVSVTGPASGLSGDLVTFELDGSKGYAIRRLIVGGYDVRATAWSQLNGDLWVPARIQVASNGVDSAAAPDRVIDVEVDESGAQCLSLSAAGAIPEDVVDILPAGTKVSDAVERRDFVVGVTDAGAMSAALVAFARTECAIPSASELLSSNRSGGSVSTSTVAVICFCFTLFGAALLFGGRQSAATRTRGGPD